MKKRSLSILFGLIMVIALIPATVFADTGYGLYVNGEPFTSEKLSINCGDGTATYDPDTATLTLNDRTMGMMIMSFMANIFGAGNSATVFSLKAMELLDEENPTPLYASNEMCMFMSLSMSMIQLVPITVIKVRSDLGSAHPEDIILPSIIAGLISMAVSVITCKLCERRHRNV